MCPHHAKGLQLSRVKGVGNWRRQQWWTKYDALEARLQKTDYWVFMGERASCSVVSNAFWRARAGKTTASTQS
jgi:hypothetical protein